MATSSKQINDALLLRGSRDFDTLDLYCRFVDEIISRRNARNGQAAGSRATGAARAALHD